MANIDFVAGSSIGLCVNAGPDRPIVLPGGAQLNGVAISSNSVSTLWSKVSGPGIVNFDNPQNPAAAATFSVQGLYILRFSASDGTVSAFDDVQVTVDPVNVPPPPDPAAIAPPLSKTVATNISTSTKFLYTGPNAIQTGVDEADIIPERAGVLRGKVTNKAGTPIPNAVISILDHPEFGQTRTRADGMFDMAVNAGGALTIKYEKANFIGVQREEKIDWQTYSQSDDVVMIPLDPNVTEINLGSSAPIQVASGSMSSDSAGQRRSMLFFKQGTQATMRLPNGSKELISLMHVRSTEFTVGETGPETMPGGLPALSAYTYAAEYSIDEAVAVGATDVTFSQPVVQYNENFLGFPVGVNVPSGSYDKAAGIWMPSANGRVIKILSISGGQANLDLNGSGTPATDPEYAALGINTAERQQLATLYAVNQELWRVPVIHFSAWDSNFGFGPPGGSGPPGGGNASGGGGPGGGGPGGGGPCGPNEGQGCVIGMQDQRLSENVDIVGTRFFLRYDSTRPRGTVANYTARIPLSGATMPGPVKRIEMTVTIAGQVHDFTFPNQPDQVTTFTWDGNDAYGRAVAGQQEATIDIGNVYDGVYQNIASFGYNGNGVPITVNTLQEITVHRVQRLTLGSYAAPAESLGGWSLSVNHAYDAAGKTLYQGDGVQRKVETVSNGIETFAGGLRGFAGDGGPISGARFTDPYGLAFAPDGTLYVADAGNSMIRKVSPDGVITRFAGTFGTGCNPSNFPCGDGGPALNATPGGLIRVGVARDGSVYMGGGRHLWKVTSDGMFHRVAGQGLDGFSGDGGQARNAAISNATRFALAADGSVYLSDMLNQRIRRIDPNGIITTIAGTGVAGFAGDGGPATQAQLNYPGDIVAAPDGNVYFVDQDNNRIRKIGPDGIISTFAGTGTFGSSPDGLAALQTNFIFRAANQIESSSLALGPEGSIYVASYTFPSGGRIRRITPDGIVKGVSGNNSSAAGTPAEGSPALGQPMRLASFALAPDRSIYTVGGFTFDFSECRIWRISAPLPDFDGGNIAIPSLDGSELYRFDPQGRHLNTMSTYTGATLYTFNYDPAGRLTSVVDGDNNTTTIERNGSGDPTGIRSPLNHVTAFTRDANGYLATITNPNNEVQQFTYSTGGLLLTKRDPRNKLNTFTYNALGHLTRDDDPFTGFQTLSRVDAGANFTVTHGTALGRQTAYQVNFLANSDRQRLNTRPDGTQFSLVEGADGKYTRTEADGTANVAMLGGDPRWKLRSPIIASTTITTPAVNYVRGFARSAVLATAGDPLSMTTQTDTITVNGRTATRAYNTATRTFTFTSPQNRQALTTIDSQNRVTAFTFANLAPFAFGYDSRGRLSSVVKGTGGSSRSFGFIYNVSTGFLSSVVNPLNETTSYTRDLAGRTTVKTLADSRNIGFGYDLNGNLSAVTPPGRPTHSFTYNELNRPATYTAPSVGGASTTSWDYNLDRQLIRVTRPDALQINLGYNATDGRLATISVPNGTFGISYNATTGKVSSVSAPGGGTVSYLYDGFALTRQTWTGAVAGNVGRTFDSSFRLSTETVNGANSVSFTYDNDDRLTAAGSLTLTRDPTNGLLTGTTLGSVNDSYAYTNGFGEATHYTARFNTTPFYDVDYTFDKLGRIMQKIEAIGGTTTTYVYGYDTTGRFRTVTVNGAPQPLVTYNYGPNNNRDSVNVGGSLTNGTYDNQDRMTAYGNATYAYTLNGELQSKIQGGGTTTYNYDVLGNLRGVTLPSGTQIDYVIDGQNRRIGKRVNGSLVQGLLYKDQLKPVAELDGSNNLVSRFVYGSRRNTPDYMIKGGTTYRMITDQVGSVRLVVDVSTGTIAQRIDYDEFGVVLNDTNPGFQPFGFAGGTYDPQTKLTRFGARDYDAETGRWTTKDPILFRGRDTNLYNYAFSDPINRVDPTGLAPCPDGPGGGGPGGGPGGGGPGGGPGGGGPGGGPGGGGPGGGPGGGGPGGGPGGGGGGSGGGSNGDPGNPTPFDKEFNKPEDYDPWKVIETIRELSPPNEPYSEQTDGDAFSKDLANIVVVP
jgi:RHS repeat-associated protein